MAEYISRNAAIEEIDEWLDTVGTVLVGKGLSYYGELIGCIEDAPAADVEPVKHGHWIKDQTTYYPDDYYCCFFDFACSKCGHIINDRYGLTNYCPNCGAKMDEVSE